MEELEINPGLCYLIPFPLLDTKTVEEVFYSLSLYPNGMLLSPVYAQPGKFQTRNGMIDQVNCHSQMWV